ncbi:MAG: DEAD/DEAH box helicase family protein [Verrucomicrobia bacterium]|nr:DEAD/DEAH box helicase family protein [Verrucomicrobiota bacterium]
MKSENFEFLRPSFPELADLGGFAERYAFSDPSTALVKLRMFAETMVSIIYSHHKLPRPYQFNLNDMLNDNMFVSMIPKTIRYKLHGLRVQGNKAAHGAETAVKPQIPVWLLQEAYDLGCWFFLSFCGGSKEACPSFIKPEPVAEEAESKKAVISRLHAEQEARMAQILKDLEDARAKAQAAEKSKDELQLILLQTQQAANVLQFDEATTRRRLIDTMLIAADWDVDLQGKNTAEVAQELEVLHQPTTTGIGYADYVLKDPDSGKPLAVIEAKKTAENAQKGQMQAKYYADGLEKMHGQRPVIFFTNGYDIFIWDDTKNEPPRKIYGFHSKDSLQYLHFQNARRELLLTHLTPFEIIVDRLYQVESIKRICERFDARRRMALLVQATGTGKTRVAIALCELLIRANWVKRVLFLCDRRELRKQAYDAFQEFLPGAPAVYVSRATNTDKEHRIYLATYPAMMKCFENFDVGFFDLIIADESHRSIYNRYHDLFVYFDAFQVGLTATPVNFIFRNTFRLFECEDKDPTANFSYEDAIKHDPPYLVPFEVVKHTTKFLREGIKYMQLNEAQREQLEEQVEDPETVDYEAEQVNRKVFSKDTDRAILRNLMENGIRNAQGSTIGKSIIFARNHLHAVQLKELFDELYPQFGGKFCAVIDNYEPRAEQLIDDLKSTDGTKELTLAISVDMLDTGIDIPSLVNLVFAKPVKSYAKFWQMIGRGTRLCQNLFGPGQHKEKFRIFDHWGNFEYFDELKKEVDPGQTKSLMQLLFECRIALVEAAIAKQDVNALKLGVELLKQDVAALPESTIAVREKWREIKSIQMPGVIDSFSPATREVLRHEIAPLMQWRNLQRREAAYLFDLLVTRLSVALIKQSAELQDHKAELLEQVSALPINLGQVKEKASVIEKLKKPAFWASPTAKDLDEIRLELRGIMHLRTKPLYSPNKPVVLDVKDDSEEYTTHTVKLEGIQLDAYKHRAEKVLKSLLEKSEVLKKICAGKTVTTKDTEALAEEVMSLDPEFSLESLRNLFADTRRLELAIRRILGMSATDVDAFFMQFSQAHPRLTSTQIRFLDLLKNHIARYGLIQVEKLWEAPFTTLNSDGLSGVFEEKEQDEILSIIKQINLDPQAD